MQEWCISVFPLIKTINSILDKIKALCISGWIIPSTTNSVDEVLLKDAVSSVVTW